MEWPNQRISLANIYIETFYHATPLGFPAKRVRYAISYEKEKLVRCS